MLKVLTDPSYKLQMGCVLSTEELSPSTRTVLLQALMVLPLSAVLL